MLAFIITIITAIATVLIFTLSAHKQELWEEIYEKSNSKK